MEQPLTYRWKNAENYFTAMLTPDLFGGWTLVTSSGAREGKSGRVRQQHLADYGKGLDAMRRLRHRRRREGYELYATGFAEFQQFDPHSDDLRSAETQALLRLFEAWRLSKTEQLGLLGVDARTLEGYLDGRPLEDAPALLHRVAHLMAINKALRQCRGEPQDRLQEWLRAADPLLGGCSPLEVMAASPDGVLAVRRHLERDVCGFS